MYIIIHHFVQGGKMPGYLISKVGMDQLKLGFHFVNHIGRSSMTRSVGALRAIRRSATASIADVPLVRPALAGAPARTLAVPRHSGRQYSTHPSKPPKQGQPLHASHPHLIYSKHLTAGIPASEYEDRRKRLMESLGDGAVVICMGNTVRLVTQRMSPSLMFAI